MAAVVSPTSFSSSSHVFPHNRNDFLDFHQHSHHRGPAASRRNPFEAFTPRHHSGPNSRSATASWRHPEPVVRSLNPVHTPSPKYHRSGPSHLHTPSTSSETSNTSRRSQIHTSARKSEGKHLSFLRCNVPLTLITSFGYSCEGFFSIGLFCRGASSTFIFASRRHQQGVSSHSR
jgi:hypothetical protein